MIPVQIAICAFGILGRNITEAYRFIKGLNTVIQKEQTVQAFLSEFGTGYVKSTLIALATCAPAIVTYFPKELLQKTGLTEDDLYKLAEEGGVETVQTDSVDKINAKKLVIPGILLYLVFN